MLASSYSLGAIDTAKAEHHRLIKPGMRVLYAGAGRGREIVKACERGAVVTCIEPCPRMAEALHRRLARACEGFTIVPRPIQSVAADPAHDLVVAHFFLNIFDAQSMPAVLEHLCGFVRPRGRLVIADFKPDTSNSTTLDRTLRSVYYKPLNIAGRLLRICTLHPIYNYEPALNTLGFAIVSHRDFSVLPGFKGYRTLTATRKQ